MSRFGFSWDIEAEGSLVSVVILFCEARRSDTMLSACESFVAQGQKFKA